MSTLRLGARATACLASTVAYLSAFEAEAALRPDRNAMLAKWVPRWARNLLAICGVELRAAGPHLDEGRAYPGQSHDGRGRVFVLNHRSAIDVLLTFAYTEARLVSRHDLARWPVIGQGARRIGTLFVDRSSMRSGATVLKEMKRALEGGTAIAIYPEGTAYPGDEVRAFRPGAFTAAHKTGAEIVPMGIAYREDEAYFGDESFLEHSQRVVGLPRLHAALEAGEPIASANRPVAELEREAHACVQELVHRARRRLA